MNRRRRRLLANIYYLRRPLVQFLPLFVTLVVLLLAAAYCFQTLDRENPRDYSESLYLVYCLLFMGHELDDFPEHWLLRAFAVVFPLLGLVVVLDGVVRFSYHILRKDLSGREWVNAVSKTMQGHVILIGLGNLGLRVLQQLLRLGEDVVVLEKNPLSPNIAYAQKNGVPVLVGSSRQEGILDDLNVAGAKSIILATSDDLANLEMAIDARKVKPGVRVVLRMFDQELASKIRDSFGLESAYSASMLAAPVFATSSSDRAIVNSFSVHDRLLVVASLTILADSELIGRTLGQLRQDGPAICLSLDRGGKSSLFPSDDTTLAAQDCLALQAEPSVLKRIHAWNHDPEPY